MVPKTKDPLDRFLDWLEAKLKDAWQRLMKFIRRLLFPIYLFPIKIVTYSLYYVVKFIFTFIFAVLGLIWDGIKFPFTGMKNFLKSIVYVLISVYLLASFFVIGDYLTKQYGHMGKFFCSIGARQRVDNAVVRVIGGKSQGSGFYITPTQILTNFHVIDGEPSPKIVLKDGSFVTGEKIVGNKNLDIAIISVPKIMTEPLYLPDHFEAHDDEPMIATGYALGTALNGGSTVMRGNYVALRQSDKNGTDYIQATISLVKGMSGGPLTDQCGNVIGVNTLGLAGLSLFVPAAKVNALMSQFTDVDVAKINVDPALSPSDAVRAFYTYLKARRMEDGFNLLSAEYLKKTNITEWTNRFGDILDVEIYKAEPYEESKDTVFVKFSTQNWVNEELDEHFYEGTWQTVKEDEVYKMNRSNIKEITNPSWEWFYN